MLKIQRFKLGDRVLIITIIMARSIIEKAEEGLYNTAFFKS